MLVVRLPASWNVRGSSKIYAFACWRIDNFRDRQSTVDNRLKMQSIMRLAIFYTERFVEV